MVSWVAPLKLTLLNSIQAPVVQLPTPPLQILRPLE